MPNPSTPEPPASSEISTPNLAPNVNRTVAASSDDGKPTDAQSIRSAHSLNSIAQTTVKHPEMHAPGLNASIVETVSAWFSDGQVNKAVVMGELALAHHGTDDSSTTEHIRLENFAVLEKVAPNPSFVSALPSKSGEYRIETSQLGRTSLAFKYQVHLEDNQLAGYAPFLLTASWKVEATQASVIISYATNPAFVPSPAVALHQLTILVGVEQTRPSSCQSKPVGHFARDKGLLYWKIGALRIDPADPPARLLARFATPSQARPGTVEARWELAGAAAEGAGSGLGVSLLTAEPGADPFADEGASTGMTTTTVPVTRKLTSGRYVVA